VLTQKIVAFLELAGGLMDTLVSRAKMDEPTEMPLGVWTGGGPLNHVIDGGSNSPLQGVLSLGHTMTCQGLSTVGVFNILSISRKRAAVTWNLTAITAATCYYYSATLQH